MCNIIMQHILFYINLFTIKLFFFKQYVNIAIIITFYFSLDTNL